MHTAYRGIGWWATMKAPSAAARLPNSYLAATPACRLPPPPCNRPSWRRAHSSKGAAFSEVWVQRSRLYLACHSGGASAGRGSRCSNVAPNSGDSSGGCVSHGHPSPPMFGCWGTGWASPHRRPFRSSTAVQGLAKKNPADLVKRITRDDLDISFARSGGAGGQNVNKVNTKADIRFNVAAAGWLPDDMKDALRLAVASRFNSKGEIVVTSTRTRSQADNVDDAIEKLQSFVDKAALAVQPIEEDPVKKKKLAKQVKKANEKRLEQKKMQSQKKGDRRGKIDY